MRSSLLSLPVILALVLVLSLTVHAKTYRVPGDFPTIQGAIDMTVNGDSVIVANGTYTGNGNRDIEFGGRAIVVRSQNGPENCIINSQGDPINYHRGFAFRDSEDSTSVLSGFTITGGYASRGGGIICNSGSPKIVGNIIRGNKSQQPGAGINCYYYSHPIIRDNLIDDNMVVEEGNFFLAGGGIACELLSAPVITSNVIRGNEAGVMGGGIYCFESAPLISNNVILHNRSTYVGWGRGGGICCRQFSGPLIINNTIYSNEADSGGGFAVYGDEPCNPDIINTILWENTPTEIYVEGLSSNPTFRYSNIQGGWQGTGNIDADPEFVDPDNGDLHLSSDSPSIDSGMNVGLDIDFEEDPRPQGYGYDMGADETSEAIDYHITLIGRGATDIPREDTLYVRALIQNNTETPVSGDFWLVVQLPNMNTIQIPEEFLNIPNPQSGEINPNDTHEPNFWVFIPAMADTGRYALRGRIGIHPDNIIDASTLRFRVME